MQDALGRICHSYLELRIHVYVDDLKLHLRGAFLDLLERTRDLYTLLKAETKKSRKELSVTKGNKEGKSKMEVFII